MTSLPPRKRTFLRLDDICVVANTPSGISVVPGVALVADEDGVAVVGPDPSARHLLPWPALSGFTCQEQSTLPDGRPATVLEVELAQGRVLRFLVPVEKVPPSETIVLETQLQALAAAHGGGTTWSSEPAPAAAPSAPVQSAAVQPVQQMAPATQPNAPQQVAASVPVAPVAPAAQPAPEPQPVAEAPAPVEAVPGPVADGAPAPVEAPPVYAAPVAPRIMEVNEAQAILDAVSGVDRDAAPIFQHPMPVKESGKKKGLSLGRGKARDEGDEGDDEEDEKPRARDSARDRAKARASIDPHRQFKQILVGVALVVIVLLNAYEATHRGGTAAPPATTTATTVATTAVTTTVPHTTATQP